MIDLKSLEGLPLADAEDAVRAAGLKPRSIGENEIRLTACIPSNVVELNYDDNRIVTIAQTQESIDAKYR